MYPMCREITVSLPICMHVSTASGQCSILFYLFFLFIGFATWMHAQLQ